MDMKSAREVQKRGVVRIDIPLGIGSVRCKGGWAVEIREAGNRHHHHECGGEHNSKTKSQFLFL